MTWIIGFVVVEHLATVLVLAFGYGMNGGEIAPRAIYGSIGILLGVWFARNVVWPKCNVSS